MEKILQISAIEYKQFLDCHPINDFLISENMGEKMAVEGWDVIYLGYYENEEMKAACKVATYKLMKIFKYGFTPRGFVIDYDDEELFRRFTSALKKYLNSLKVVYLETDPSIQYRIHNQDGDVIDDSFNKQYIDLFINNGYQHLPLWTGYKEGKNNRWVSYLDLKDKTYQQIFKGYSSRAVRNVKLARKYKLQVEELTIDDIDIFLNMEHETAKRQNFESMSKLYFTDMQKYFPENFKYYVVYGLKSDILEVLNSENDKSDALQQKMDVINACNEEKIYMAAIVNIEYGNKMLYLAGASKYDYRGFRGPFILHDEIIHQCIDKQLDEYDFYGISGLFNEEDEGYGVYQFKKGFGSNVREYIGNFILPIKPIPYLIFKTFKKKYLY